MEQYFFKYNELVYYYDLQLFPALKSKISKNDINNGQLVACYHKDKFSYFFLSKDVLALLNLFDGKTSVDLVFKKLLFLGNNYFLIKLDFSMLNGDLYVLKKKFKPLNDVTNLFEFIKYLFLIGLIDLLDSNLKYSLLNNLDTANFNLSNILVENDEVLFYGQFCTLPIIKKLPNKVDILLVGSTTGIATTGILYLASYLKQNGINAVCQLADFCMNLNSLKVNIENLLKILKPKILGVSIKWFPHIARGLEICKIAKNYSKELKVVLGGNTATYYCDELITYDYVDYIILGDGEVPILTLCRNEKEIPNLVYKIGNKVLKNDITYIQDKNTKEIYLSYLADTLIYNEYLLFNPFIYIYTGKGCNMNCFYCAGCKETQYKIFSRNVPFLRNFYDVKADIIALKNYTLGFLFDFDLPDYDDYDYYEKIWTGIDLSNHFCIFYFWRLPRADFLELVAKTFKYVFIILDMCSLSERHRLQLAKLKLVKPQPTEKELYLLLDKCEKYKNIKLKITLIAGLPFFNDDDIKICEQTVYRLLNSYSCFIGLEWGRLHAQPGASLPNLSEKYEMYSMAKTFDDYFNFSKKNLLTKPYYPDTSSLNYPFIYFKDENLNSKITTHYLEITELIADAVAY